MKKILVPCDFSDSARQAYAFALNIAKKSQAEIFVLKAIDIPFIYENFNAPNPFYFDPGLIRELEEDAKTSFEKMKAGHDYQEKVFFQVVQGPVTPSILSFVKDHNIDLVVMGTHGTSGFTEYLIGSNTEKVVRFSPVPVLAVRKSAQLASIKKIVFPTALKLDEVAAVNKIKELQSFFGATLHLLLVNTPVNLKRTKDEKEEMEAYAKHYKLENYTLNIRDDFYEQNGIMSFAREIQADMIAMTTHSRRGLSHLFLGSVTEDVVNHAACPIWTYSLKK